MGGTKRKFNSARRKSRSYSGNQHGSTSSKKRKPTTPVSAKKLSGKNPMPIKGDYLQGNRFMDMELLAPVFQMFPCPTCSTTNLEFVESNRYGLASKFEIVCHECDWKYSFLNTKKTSHAYQINRRAYYAMRRVGGGHEHLKRFMYLMNHPPPVNEKNYRRITYVMNTAIKTVANRIMLDAADELRGTNQGTVDVGATFDGTWQRRGFTSMNGTTIAISIDTGRVLDVDIMSRFCQVCVNDNDNNTKSKHNCTLNHDGSAPKMEQSGIVRMFERSIEKNDLRYTEYYGDGDTKSHSSVANIYPGKPVIKRECIGHVQKRVGKHLRQLKKVEKGLGRLGLNDATIDRLQNYYGMALRSNVESVDAMKNNIYAALMHICSNKDNNYHWKYCPAGGKSWCSYQRDIANKTTLHKPGRGLHPRVISHVKKVFLDLSKTELLSRCLHGKTQNQNEAFNATIWHRLPKQTFVKLRTFEIGVLDAVAHFNIGNMATLLIFDELGIERGYWTSKGCYDNNRYRIKNSVKKSTDENKTRRRKLRGLRKHKNDTEKKNEGKVYGAGIAD